MKIISLKEVTAMKITDQIGTFNLYLKNIIDRYY